MAACPAEQIASRGFVEADGRIHELFEWPNKLPAQYGV